MKRCVCIVLSCLLLTAIYAQDISQYSPKRLKSLAQNAFAIGDTYSAIDYYKAYCAKKPDTDAYFQLAECYRAAREYLQAADYYDKSYREDKKNLVALYHYGEMLKVYGYYKDAKKCFIQFKQSYKGNSEYKHLVVSQIASCDSAQKLIDSSQAVEIRRLNGTINKHSIEFSPVFYDDSTLLFASLRSDTALFVSAQDRETDMPYRHFYVAKKKKGDWQFMNEWIEGEFNQDALHSGNGVFSPDRKRFYFTKCEQNWRYKTICKIYVSQNIRGSWTAPEELPKTINQRKTTNTQPAVATESKRGDEVLYFASDRPGGKGGMDIWYSVKEKNRWHEAKNCGNRINTPFDEVTPYYSMQDRTLYFSSNGWPGFGELDVFKSQGELAKWEPVENAGYYINSGFDDLYYSANFLNSEGFLTSNRQNDSKASTCCDDIFSFKYVDQIHITVEGLVYMLPDSEVDKILQNDMETESSNQRDSVQYVKGSVVTLFMVDDVTNEKLYIAIDSTDEKGSYSFDLRDNRNYVLQYESGKYTPPTRTISTKDMTQPDTIHVEDVGIEYISRDIFRIKNIYYEFDKSNLTLQSKQIIARTILYIMREYPQLVVEIGSHTDSKGSDSYNLKLSQKRAESVVNYLIENGIEKERLRAKGYGETKPIAPNEDEDGNDNPEGRAKNRRTEFRVIGTINQYFEIIYEE